MTAVLDALLEDAGTGSSIRKSPVGGVCLAQRVAPVAFFLIGGVTGATACVAPSELLDWTSADVIELLQPARMTHQRPAMAQRQIVEPQQTAAQRQLDDLRR